MVVLKPFIKATETLSAGNTRLSQVIPLVRELEKQMEKFQRINVPGWGRPLSPNVQALVRQLKEGIRRRLDPLQSSPVHMMVSMCDQRVKGSMCTGSTKTLHHWTQLLVNKVREAELQRSGDVEEGDPLSCAFTPSTSTSASTSQSPPCQTLQMWAMGMASMLVSKCTRLQPRTSRTEASVAT